LLQTSPLNGALCFCGVISPCEAKIAMRSWTVADGQITLRVSSAAGMLRERVRALASFELSAHDANVETAKWSKPQRVAGAKRDAAADRTTRLCHLCQRGMGDELHMWADCEKFGCFL
jgi:hypothetical protein